MHDLRLGYARELGAALGEASYEVPELLTGFLGARLQVLGVPWAQVCEFLMKVRTRSSQLWI
jgi:hypothetical protein